MEISNCDWDDILETGKIVGEGDMAQKYQLDFSIESISRLDEMISDLWQGEQPNDINKIGWVFGCYLALIINDKFNGHWTRDAETNQIVFISAKSQISFSPWVWVVKRFQLDESLASKSNVIFNMLTKDKQNI